jgi:hypothetical protein
MKTYSLFLCICLLGFGCKKQRNSNGFVRGKISRPALDEVALNQLISPGMTESNLLKQFGQANRSEPIDSNQKVLTFYYKNEIPSLQFRGDMLAGFEVLLADHQVKRWYGLHHSAETTSFETNASTFDAKFIVKQIEIRPDSGKQSASARIILTNLTAVSFTKIKDRILASVTIAEKDAERFSDFTQEYAGVHSSVLLDGREVASVILMPITSGQFIFPLNRDISLKNSKLQSQ